MAPAMPDFGFGRGAMPRFYVRVAWALGLLVLPILVQPLWPLGQFSVPGALVCLMEDMPPGKSVAMLWLVTAASLAICAGIAGVTGAVWVLEAGGLWSVFWICRRRNLTAPETLLLGFLFLAVSFLFFLAVASPKGFLYTYGQLKASVAKQMDIAYKQYIKMGLIKKDTPQYRQWLNEWKQIFLDYLPCFLSLGLAMISGVNTAVSRYVGRRFFSREVFGPQFSDWRFPDELIWLAIASGAAAIWGKPPWALLGKNCLVFLAGLYYIQGLAIMSFYLKRLKVPAFVRGLCYALISLEWYGLLIVAITGVLDVWFDLRNFSLPSIKNRED